MAAVRVLGADHSALGSLAHMRSRGQSYRQDSSGILGIGRTQAVTEKESSQYLWSRSTAGFARHVTWAEQPLNAAYR